MDRYETVVKAQEIIELAHTKQYEKACEILETINTSKMKNYDELIIFAEVYLKNKKYKEAKEILKRLHERTKTRRLMALLISVNSKMYNFVEAEQCYEEYVRIAPRDVNRFILRYKIDKAKGLGYDVLIRSLEQLKEYDLIEEWAYELAKLYHKAGYEDKCVSECNTIIMMFGEGVIVEKAKLLREHHLDAISKNSTYSITGKSGAGSEFDATVQLNSIINQVKEKMTDVASDSKIKSSDDTDYGEGTSISPTIEEEYAKDNDKVKDEIVEHKKTLEELYVGDEQMRIADTPPENDEDIAQESANDNTGDKSVDSSYKDEDDYGDGVRQLNLLDDFLNMGEKENAYDKDDEEISDTEDKADTENAEDSKDADTTQTDESKQEDISDADNTSVVGEDSDNTDDISESDESVTEVDETDGYYVEGIDDDEIDDDFINNLSDMVNSELDKIFEQTRQEASVKSIVSPKAMEAFKDGDKNSDNDDTASETNNQDEQLSDDGIEQLDNQEYSKVMEHLTELLNSSLYDDTKTEDINEQVFRNFYFIPSLRANIRCTLAQLKEDVVRGNFIICGKAKTGKTTLAKMIAKVAYSRDIIDTSKIARIDAQKFNQVDLEHKQDKLADGCLIIQNAHLLTPAAMTSLITMIIHLNGRIVVFLETDYDEVSKVYTMTAEVREYFSNVVSTPEYSEKELMGFARSYAAYKGYSFCESGVFAMEELIDSVYKNITQEQRIPFVLTSVEKAIRASHNRNTGGFGRPNYDGLNVLDMQDVEQQYS